jgi:hypothetical protein
MSFMQVIAFILILTLPADSPEPEQVIVSRYRIIRGVMAETRHDLVKNKCYKILHLKECEVEYDNI